MANDNDNHRPSKEVEQLTLVARESLRHILEGWVYNVNFGKAIDAYRRQLFRELGITKPNHQYKEIMGRYLRANEFHRINKTTRTFLQKCIDNLAAIEQWRATLTEEERDAWNGPRAVWDHWPDKPENLRQVKPKPADIIWVAIRGNGEEDYLVFENQGDVENCRGSYEVTRGLGSCVVRPEPASNFDFTGCILSDDGVWERDGETPPKRVASVRLPKNYSEKITNPKPKGDPIVAVLSQLYPKIYKRASDPTANAMRRKAREQLKPKSAPSSTPPWQQQQRQRQRPNSQTALPPLHTLRSSGTPTSWCRQIPQRRRCCGRNCGQRSTPTKSAGDSTPRSTRCKASITKSIKPSMLRPAQIPLTRNGWRISMVFPVSTHIIIKCRRSKRRPRSRPSGRATDHTARRTPSEAVCGSFARSCAAH
jgi:hypothetical protein